jgi:hypothetical protein
MANVVDVDLTSQLAVTDSRVIQGPNQTRFNNCYICPSSRRCARVHDALRGLSSLK